MARTAQQEYRIALHDYFYIGVDAEPKVDAAVRRLIAEGMSFGADTQWKQGWGTRLADFNWTGATLGVLPEESDGD